MHPSISLTRRRGPPALRALALALAAAWIAACSGDALVPPQPDEPQASLQLSANLSATPIRTLVLEVTGPGMDRLVYNLEVQNGTAAGTLKMPPGPARTLLVRAFDGSGRVTHQGSATFNVEAGTNPPVQIPLTSNSGHVPVTVHVGDHSVTVSPASATVAAGGTVQLAATVVGAGGDTLSVDVRWATLDPSRATVTSSGLVSGVAAGQVQIVATYAGVGGSSLVTVQ